MYLITKEFSFSASHRLDGLDPSHPCSRDHGHNYVVKLTLMAITLNEVGFVVDYRSLDNFKLWLDNLLDHRHLNEIVEFNPTAENLARWIFDLYAKGHFDFGSQTNFTLKSVTVCETPKTEAVYMRTTT